MHDDHADDPFDDQHDRVLSAVIFPDGLFGVTTSRSGEVRIWGLPGVSPGDRRCVAVSGRHRAPVTCAVFAPGVGNRILFTGGDSVMRWSIGAGSVSWRRVDTYLGGRIRSLAVSSDGRSVLAAVDGEWIRWWRPYDDTGRVLGAFGTPDTVAFGRDDLIIFGSGEGDVGCWSAADIEQHGIRSLWEFRSRESASRGLLRVCDRGRLVVSPRYGRVVVLSVEDGSEVAVFGPPARPTSIAVHPDAPLVVLGGLDGSLTWWDARSGRSLGRVQAHEGRVRAVAMASGDLVLSGSGDGTAALWRMHGHRPLGRFDPAPASRPAVPYGQEDPWELGVACGSPDGRSWLVGGHGGQVHILTWSESEGLRPVRAGHPRAATGQLDMAGLVDDLRDHHDADTGAAAARALNTPWARAHFERPAGQDEWPHVAKALQALAVHGAGKTAREAAMITLGTADSRRRVAAFERLGADVVDMGPASGDRP
jgi:WD40 repeat protein